jgi:expansin (peptidoglycan-binding protein)
MPSYATAASPFSTAGLSKRFDHAKMTFYDVGLGACGHNNQPSDFFVALNAAEYDSGHHCGQRIQIRANGKSSVAQVVDRCTGCEGHGLDLSKGLFSHFADTKDGVFAASWDFISDHHVRLFVLSLAPHALTARAQYQRQVASSDAAPSPRSDGAHMTHYEVGLGACAWRNKPSDFVGALNSARYGSGEHCGQQIQIRANGKTATAQVVDECPGCEGDGLDLSDALFEHFAPSATGEFVGSWDFVVDHAHHVRNSSTEPSSAITESSTPSTSFTCTATSTPSPAATPSNPSPLIPRSKQSGANHGALTWYKDGLGARGWTNQPSDYVVALNSAQYGSGQYCGRRIEITAEGKTAIAAIVDECPGCGAGGLDLSHGLFEHFAPDTKGVLSGSWRFVS